MLGQAISYPQHCMLTRESPADKVQRIVVADQDFGAQFQAESGGSLVPPPTSVIKRVPRDREPQLEIEKHKGNDNKDPPCQSSS